MEPMTKRTLFAIAAILAVSSISLWSKEIYTVIGAFAIGCVIAELSNAIFPDNFNSNKGETK